MTPEQTDLLKIKIYQIERAVRNVRLGLESILLEHDYLNKRKVEIKNSLTDLLTSGKSIKQRSVAPFESFYEGLNCSYALEGKDNKVTVVAHGHTVRDSNVDPASTLMLAVVSDKKIPSAWFALELNLEKEKIKEYDSIDFSFSPSFRVPENTKLDNFKVVIRGLRGGNYNDYYSVSFPSLSIPMEFKYSIEQTEFKTIPFEDFDEIKLIIFLPSNLITVYSFILSSFEISGILR